MEKKQEHVQEQHPDEKSPPSTEVAETSADSPVSSDVLAEEAERSRPRNLGEHRVVQREEARQVFETTREIETLQSRDHLTASLMSTPETIDHHADIDASPADSSLEQTVPHDTVGSLEDRETVKWAAWGALLISLITSFLLAMYASRDFSPAFEYQNLELIQKRLSTDVERLKYSTHLERIENAILHAQFEITARKDYEAAELILDTAKADLQGFIDSLPIEDTVEPKQILSSIDRALREVRRGPSALEENLKKIADDLTKINPSKKF